MSPSELLDMARAACESAVSAGADMAEVRASSGRGTSVRVERSSVDSTESRISSGASIRAFVNGGLGAVSFDGLGVDRLVAGAQRAAALARSASADREFKTLPAPGPDVEVPGLYDPAIAEMGVPELSAVVLECVESALQTAPEAVCTGSASAAWSVSAVANSLGVGKATCSSNVSAWIEPIVRRGDDVGAFYEWDAARRLEDFDHRAIGAAAAETALRLLASERVESGVMPVVLGPLAAHSLFVSLAASAEAESHQRGRSWLKGKLGHKIASGVVTIYDDATVPAGLGSRPYDSEGVSSRPIAIVENGVLTNLLHSSYTANKAGVEYTGHAQGGGVGPTNVIPVLGAVPSDEIIRGVERGLYINMGGIAPDSTTGEVSASVDFGFLIENGEVTRGISNTMIGMNGLELLAGIDAISADARMEPGTPMPTVRVQRVRVAGSR